jgi:hypothetical protein
MYGDSRVDQIAPERPQPCQRAFLVGASQFAVAHYIGRQNCCEFSVLGHNSTSTQTGVAQPST